MGESAKSFLALIAIIGAGASAVAWGFDDPTSTAWVFRIVTPAISVLAIGFILKLHFRRDREPDYLYENLGEYFLRNGFGFAFVVTVRGGVAYMNAYFQSQYEGPSLAQIAIRPERKSFTRRAKIETLLFEVECAPAAYGAASVPFAVPKKLQGTQIAFELGASVKYPKGKGRRLRFRDGIFLRANTNFGKGFEAALTVAGAMGGSIVLSRPAHITMTLPVGVSETVPVDSVQHRKTFWKLGDPPLDDTQ